jgi:hypothetical protein
LLTSNFESEPAELQEAIATGGEIGTTDGSRIALIVGFRHF